MTTPTISVRGGVGGISANTDDLRAAAVILDVAGRELSLLLKLLRQAVSDSTLAASAVLDPDGASTIITALSHVTAGPGSLPDTAQRCSQLAQALRQSAQRYIEADTLHHALHPGWFDIAMTILTPLGLGREVRFLSVPYRDGRAVATPLGPDPVGDRIGPPRGIADLMSGLVRRGRGAAGEIDVRTLTTTDVHGVVTTRVIVDITGTTDWSLRPDNPVISDIASNMHAIDNDATAFGDGVVAALRAAGVSADTQIMMVGHSLGGLVALELANRLSSSSEFTVTHVVTAGAPIALMAVPASVSVLALENRDDVVPKLDGKLNPDRTNEVTVQIDSPGHSLIGDHAIGDAYLPGARVVDASNDTSIRAFIAGASGFLTADDVATQRFVVSRVPK
jgi:hypothetical protein